MVTITKSTILSGIWQNFYDRIKSQVTSVATGLTDVGTSTVQTYSSNYSDKISIEKASYPIITVEHPVIDTELFTFGKTTVNGTISVEVFANQSVTSVLLIDLVINAIETFKGSLAALGITELDIDSTDNDNFKRGALNVHSRLVRFKFKYRYTRTRAW